MDRPHRGPTRPPWSFIMFNNAMCPAWMRACRQAWNNEMAKSPPEDGWHRGSELDGGMMPGYLPSASNNRLHITYVEAHWRGTTSFLLSGRPRGVSARSPQVRRAGGFGPAGSASFSRRASPGRVGGPLSSPTLDIYTPHRQTGPPRPSSPRNSGAWSMGGHRAVKSRAK